MLTAAQFDEISTPIVELYRRYEDTVIRDIARRLAGLDYARPTAAWQMQRLTESGALYEDILKQLEVLTGQSVVQLRQIFQRAGVKAMRFDDSIYKAAGLRPLPLNLSPVMAEVLSAGLRKTQGMVNNLTQTTAISGQQAFMDAADLAYMQISTGAFDYQSALRQAVKDIAAKGLTMVQYAGRQDHLDVAIRRAVLTGIGQTTGELQWRRADEMGQDLVQVTAHAGARNTGTGPANHESWQGKVYSRSGASKQYKPFIETTGYGTGAGLLGWNCRHHYFPFFAGLSENAYEQVTLDEFADRKVTYNGKEMSFYEATQQQRGIERKIRYWKRQAGALESAGLPADTELSKVREWQATMRDFTKQTRLVRQPEREWVVSTEPRTVLTPTYIKSYPGVTINVGDNQSIEKVVESSLDELQKQGYDFPKTIRTDAQFFVKYGEQESSPCAYLNGVLYINDKHSAWKNPVDYMKTNYASKYFSTDKPEAMIWHEIGHYLHHQQNPHAFNKFRVGGFLEENDKLIASMVSGYAAEGADEFVAEVFAARVAKMDMNFPVDIFLLLQKYGGILW